MYCDGSETEIKEDEVLRTAFGDGKSDTNAYSLFYVREDVIKASSYDDFVPDNLRNTVFIEEEFFKEVNE